MDSTIGFPNTYLLENDLSDGSRYPTFEQVGPVVFLRIVILLTFLGCKHDQLAFVFDTEQRNLGTNKHDLTPLSSVLR